MSEIMSRPSDVTSKPIAARVPMPDYIKFLQESSEKGISISDFLLMKIYNTETIQLQADLMEEKRLHSETQNLLAEKDGETINLKKELSEAERKRHATTQAHKEKNEAEWLKERHRAAELLEASKSAWVKEKESLTAKISKLEADHKTVSDKSLERMKTVLEYNQGWKKRFAELERKYKDVLAINGQTIDEITTLGEKDFWKNLPEWIKERIQKLPR